MTNQKQTFLGDLFATLKSLIGIVVLSLITIPSSAIINKHTGLYNTVINIELPDKITRPSFTSEITRIQKQLMASYKLKEDKAARFAEYFLLANETTQIPINILAALIMTESTYKEKSRSYVGAIGPAQIRPKFWKDFCYGNLSNAKDNVLCAADILKKYYNKSNNDWTMALSYYNVGPANYNKSKKQRKAAKRYIKKIFKNIKTFDEHSF